MKNILGYLRKKPKLYKYIRNIYGNTFGLWSIKTFYLKYIGIWNGKIRLKLLKEKWKDKIIFNKIISGEPFMYARYGSSEFRAIINQKDFPLVCFYSGFFPEDIKLRDKFREVYFEGTKQIDILGVWNYKNHFFKKTMLLRKFPNIKYITNGIDIKKKNKDWVVDSWVRSLENKRILVIHPFKKTIELQMKKRKQLGILPKFKSFDIIKSVQTLAGNRDLRFKNWFEALEYMKKKINNKNFDILLIGCGAYGLPLAAHAKSLNKQAIHMGGSLQLLFGIKGKRWEDAGWKFDKNWIYPLEEDRIKNYKDIEGGCYW